MEVALYVRGGAGRMDGRGLHVHVYREAAANIQQPRFAMLCWLIEASLATGDQLGTFEA
jgi:hypothetical protein